MSVSLTEELKIDQTGVKNHEIMDIKKEFQTLNQIYNSIIEALSSLKKISSPCLLDRDLLSKFLPEIRTLFE
jgi:hypothetical protein